MSSNQSVKEQVLDSIWYVEAEIPGQSQPYQGSAILVELKNSKTNETKKYLLTCLHVVCGVTQTGGPCTYHPATKIRCWRPGSDYTKKDESKSYVAHFSGIQPTAFEEMDKLTASEDWLLLQCDDQEFLDIKADTIWASKQEQIPSEQMLIAGYPDGINGFEKKGKARRVWATPIESLKRSQEANDFAFTIDTLNTKPGMSGGGCFNAEGTLVGLHREGHDDSIKRTEIRIDRIADLLLDLGYMPVAFATNGETKATNDDGGRRNLYADSKLLKLQTTNRFGELVGREKEFERLTSAWQDNETKVMSLVGWGGVGKTSLVACWLAKRIEEDWEGIDAFYDESFYSQGTTDQSNATSAGFIDGALRHFGLASVANESIPIDEKAKKLADRIARSRALVILDGVEPLQHPTSEYDLEGRFKDSGIKCLLLRLVQAKNNQSFCIVTTRSALIDLGRFFGGSVKDHELKCLSRESAAELLHTSGVNRAGSVSILPKDQELLDVAAMVHNHPLTLRLLGSFLKNAHRGDVRRYDLVDWQTAIEVEQEGHTMRVMQAYENWLAENGSRGRRQCAALRLLGFFDRPAPKDCLDALRRERIYGLTERICDLSSDEWDSLLGKLESFELISLTDTDVNAHPLVRAYFARRLIEMPGGRLKHVLGRWRNTPWLKGHRRLYKWLMHNSKSLPRSVQEMQPIYQAISHGCKGELDQLASDAYRKRIIQDADYSSKHLGAIHQDLSAVACFFEGSWSAVTKRLSEDDQVWMLNEAAYALRAVGRIAESIEPMQVVVRRANQRKQRRRNPGTAAQALSNLSELELNLGNVDSAIRAAREAVSLADQSGDDEERRSKRTTLGDALQHGDLIDEARQNFEEAESIGSRPLQGVMAAQLFDLSLRGAERVAWNTFMGSDPTEKEAALEACNAVSDWCDENEAGNLETQPILDRALIQLSHARAMFYRLVITESRTRVQVATLQALARESLVALRLAGYADELARGLITNAWISDFMGDREYRENCLDEALELAERGPMPLALVDIDLHRSRLVRDPALLRIAGDKIESLSKQGFRRRDKELQDSISAAENWV